MKNIITIIFMLLGVTPLLGQERAVIVDFESNSFRNSPTIPFDQPFMIQGEISSQIEYVEVTIHNENSERELYSFLWNRYGGNNSEAFQIIIPEILISNSKYDFEINTYNLVSDMQKEKLIGILRERVIYYLNNNISYNGNKVQINNPKYVYRDLAGLVDEALIYYRSKNSIRKPELSNLIVEELERYNDFKFSNFLKRREAVVKDSLALELIDEKVNDLAAVVISEVIPFINSDLVQLDRKVFVKSVSTDKEAFTLPVNVGMYAWSKSIDVTNTTVKNMNFTPGVGITLPFSNKSSILTKSKLLDSFGYSIGILLSSVKDVNGVEYNTPGINMPVYTGLGLRMFKVVRLNAGILVLAEKGIQDFSSISIIPTAGLALELNVWAGIKK